MQTAQTITEVTNINKKHLSGYELTYKTLKNLSQFDITVTAKLVLVYLTTHYNEAKNGAVVFPSVQHIADTLGTGLTATKKAIKDLIEAGLIIKSKRDKVRGNCNKYLIMPKVHNMTLKQSESEPLKQSENDRFMITSNMKLSKETTTHEKSETREPKKVVVALSSKTSKRAVITLDDVPSIIKDNPKVINPCAYWADLDENARQTYLKREAEVKHLQVQKAERKRAEAEEKARQEVEERKRREELARPMHEQYTKAQAIRVLYNMRNVARNIDEKSMWYPLVKHYNLDLASIYAMSKEEIEKLS